MCTYLSGSKSSPSRNNYTLKRTSVDYQTNFGEAATKTFQKKIYVDITFM